MPKWPLCGVGEAARQNFMGHRGIDTSVMRLLHCKAPSSTKKHLACHVTATEGKSSKKNEELSPRARAKCPLPFFVPLFTPRFTDTALSSVDGDQERERDQNFFPEGSHRNEVRRIFFFWIYPPPPQSILCDADITRHMCESPNDMHDLCHLSPSRCAPTSR